MKKKSITTFISETLLLLITLIAMLPIYYFTIGAFKTRADIVKHPLEISAKMLEFGNFGYAVEKMSLLKSLMNTGFITVVSLLLIIFLGSMAGFAISRINRKIFKVFYTILVALMVVPFIGTVLSLVVLSRKLNLYNTLWGCILIQVGWNLPFATFLFTGFMRTLPKELEEAAYIDGCSMIKTYKKIFLPLLSSVTATCCIYCGIGIWNDYLVSNSILNGNKTPTLMVGIRIFFGQRVTEYGYAFSGIILSSLPIIILFLMFQKNFVKGIAAGAVKG